jgi:hypothetical protein
MEEEQHALLQAIIFPVSCPRKSGLLSLETRDSTPRNDISLSGHRAPGLDPGAAISLGTGSATGDSTLEQEYLMMRSKGAENEI